MNNGKEIVGKYRIPDELDLDEMRPRRA